MLFTSISSNTGSTNHRNSFNPAFRRAKRGGILATYRDGVLELIVNKRVECKPIKVEVN